MSLALLEIDNLSPTLIIADQCVKTAQVEVLGIESTMGSQQCLKLAGSPANVRIAAEMARDIALTMGSKADLVVMPGPTDKTREVATQPPAFIPLLGINDQIVKRDNPMKSSDALGLIETQGLVAALHATDEMLKASAVTLVGKEKIGAAYVTIIVRGDVAAVQAAIEAGKQAVERLDGTLILADVIPRPHPELAALLPA